MKHLQPCGTAAAYKRHLRRGETPCQPCRAANAERCRRDGYRTTGPRPPSNKPAAIARRAHVAKQNAEKAEDYRWLLETGCRHPEMIARRMGYKSVEALAAFVHRNGLPWVGMREAA